MDVQGQEQAELGVEMELRCIVQRKANNEDVEF